MLTKVCHQLALAREAIVTVGKTVTKWHSPMRARSLEEQPQLVGFLPRAPTHASRMRARVSLGDNAKNRTHPPTPAWK